MRKGLCAQASLAQLQLPACLVHAEEDDRTSRVGCRQSHTAEPRPMHSQRRYCASQQVLHDNLPLVHYEDAAHRIAEREARPRGVEQADLQKAHDCRAM